MTRPQPEKIPECRSCRHYFVTYEARWPHGCRAFDMKSKRLPCLEVAANSGERCHGWEVRRQVRDPGRRA